MLDHVHESDEEYHSFSGNEPEDGEDDLDDEVADQPPAHPVQSMQAAFEESILESTEDAESTESSTKPDAESRRQKLLEQKYYDDSWTTRWKQKPGAQYHPLLKLMAQIVFGMHLLQQQQAKSDAEVVKILQTHVDEVDSFLEKTSEDFDLAIKDIEERVRFLKLPMTHLDVFDIMLDDKKFRTQLIDGNDKIEKIIDRSAKAMNAALLDVRRGKQATEELKVYLSQVRRGWPRDNRDLAAIYGAMRGNEEGWMKCLRDLKMKGNKLSEALVQLGTTIGEMSKLAAAASRRNKPSSRHGSVSSTGSLGGSVGPRSKFARDPPKSRFAPAAVDKPLPKEPDTVGPAVRATVLRSQPATRDHAIPFEQRFERPRRQPPTPTSPRSLAPETSSPRTTSPLPKRPATAGQMAPRDARTNHIRSETAELADFFRGGGGPLSSNPPDEVTTFASRPGSRGAEKTLARSTSRGADQALSRSRSRGAESALDQSKERDQNDSVGGQATGGAERSLSRSQSRDAKGTLSPPHSPTLRKDSVASSGITTGFTRRLSKRQKHLPPPGYIPNQPAANMDSAYSSGTDTQAPPARYATSGVQRTTASVPRSASGSRLGLFPAAAEPLTPSAASTRSSVMPSPAPSPGPSPSASNGKSSVGKSRTLSIKNMFHRKQKSQPMLA